MAVVLEFRSRAAQILADQQKVIDQAKEMAEGYKETAKEAGQLERAAQRLNKQLETPQERHNRKLKELATLLKTGRIHQEQMTRAVDQYNRELREAETGGDRAFGAGSVAKLAAFAGGFVSLGAAVGAVTAQLQELVRARDEAADSTLRSRRGMAQLAQLAATQPHIYPQVNAEIREFFGAGAATDLGDAAASVFDLRSSEMNAEDRKLFRDAAAQGVIAQPGAAAEAIAALRASMPNAPGTSRDIINEALVAAAPGASTFEELLIGAAKGGTGAAELGVSRAANLAGTGVLSRPFASATVAGDRIAALYKSLERGGFKGSLSGMLDAVQARLDKGEGFADVFGGTQDFEAIQAFRLLQSNRPLLETLTRDVAAAPGRDPFATALSLPDTDPILRSARIRQATTQRSELEIQQSSGVATNLLQAFEAESQSRAVRNPGILAAIGRAIEASEVSIERALVGDARTLELMRARATPQDPELKKAIDEFLAQQREQTDTLKRIEQNQSGRPPVTRVEGRQE